MATFTKLVSNQVVLRHFAHTTIVKSLHNIPMDPAPTSYWRTVKASCQRDVLYEDATGFIVGHKRLDGHYWIEKFVLYEEYRGKGLAKALASHLPKKSRLLAYPLMESGSYLPLHILIRFYESLGFKSKRDAYGNTIMVRG